MRIIILWSMLLVIRLVFKVELTANNKWLLFLLTVYAALYDALNLIRRRK